MQTLLNQLMVTYIDPESGWQPGHPIVVPAQASTSGTLGHQVLVAAREACALSDLAQSVACMTDAASAASTVTWHVVGTDK